MLSRTQTQIFTGEVARFVSLISCNYSFNWAALAFACGDFHCVRTWTCGVRAWELWQLDDSGRTVAALAGVNSLELFLADIHCTRKSGKAGYCGNICTHLQSNLVIGLSRIILLYKLYSKADGSCDIRPVL